MVTSVASTSGCYQRLLGLNLATLTIPTLFCSFYTVTDNFISFVGRWFGSAASCFIHEKVAEKGNLRLGAVKLIKKRESQSIIIGVNPTG